ncbi:hypothetical protein [Streptomyces decoyicus]|uniref:hypothetical protein n=1 Tax=Streptomyces decoyicus TaxID=249567 RepID=UPI00386E04EB|nr:hypothetical protein OG532_39170 [Streptomyces decoyicus]
MEGAGSLAVNAVQVLTAMATGAATAVGTGSGQLVTELVRRRLGDSEQGRAAVAGVSADPTDPQAAEGLRSVLQETLTADPEFAGRLAQALAGHPPASPPTYTHSVVVDGRSKLRSSQISLGPLTISNTRNTRSSLGAAVALLVVLLVLGTYGAVRLFTGDDAPDSAPDQQSGMPVTVAKVIDDPARAESVFPGPGSLPKGWELKKPEARVCGTFRLVCENSLLDIEAYYGGPEESGAHLEMFTYPSAGEASAGYKEQKAFEMDRYGDVPITVGDIDADEAAAVGMTGTGTTVLSRQGVLRSGTVVIAFSGEASEGQLRAFMRALAARAQQLQAGEKPTAAIQAW